MRSQHCIEMRTLHSIHAEFHGNLSILLCGNADSTRELWEIRENFAIDNGKKFCTKLFLALKDSGANWNASCADRVQTLTSTTLRNVSMRERMVVVEVEQCCETFCRRHFDFLKVLAGDFWCTGRHENRTALRSLTHAFQLYLIFWFTNRLRELWAVAKPCSNLTHVVDVMKFQGEFVEHAQSPTSSHRKRACFSRERKTLRFRTFSQRSQTS